MNDHAAPEVEADRGFYLAPRAASGFTVRLANEDGRWVVEESQTTWIS